MRVYVVGVLQPLSTLEEIDSRIDENWARWRDAVDAKDLTWRFFEDKVKGWKWMVSFRDRIRACWVDPSWFKPFVFHSVRVP